MTSEWTQMEHGALVNFLAGEGPLRAALEKFTRNQAEEAKSMCAVAMRSVPRNPELAADYAAKAQAFGEFWEQLLHAAGQQEFVAEQQS